MVSEIHKKNLYCPYKPPKIMTAFMVFSFQLFLVFELLKKVVLWTHIMQGISINRQNENEQLTAPRVVYWAKKEKKTLTNLCSYSKINPGTHIKTKMEHICYWQHCQCSGVSAQYFSVEYECILRPAREAPNSAKFTHLSWLYNKNQLWCLQWWW